MVTLHRVARLLCGTALALPVLGAQPTHDAGPVFGSGLDLVRLTVTVRDEKGNLIPNLEEAAFKVYEDGRPQKIQVFARSVEPGHDADLALDLGLLFDTSESMLDVLKLSQEAAVRFLEAIFPDSKLRPLGVSDIDIAVAYGIILLFAAGLFAACLVLIRRGVGIRT